MISYSDFIATKLSRVPPTGLANVPALSESLFPFQRDLVRWSLRRGRAALFADTGLGKTRMQLEWAHRVAEHTGRAVLILAPLAVASQTVREGVELGIGVKLVRDGIEIWDDYGIYITNYDRIHKFDASRFVGVVLDESSCIKHYNAKTLDVLLKAFRDTPWKLCATATPAPNDYTELGTHAEFLGICTRAEMLSEYFCHDGGETQTWRLKGHARKEFWRFVASWGALLRRPSDLGYDDDRYALPPLVMHHHIAAADQATTFATGVLFATEARDLVARRTARKASLSRRVLDCSAVVNADRDEPWIVWCDLNAESEALVGAIPGAVEIRGNQTPEEKEKRLVAFAEGRTRVLVTKASMTGFGLNWQHCARQAFVGVNDSYEEFYQAIRRSWRFGQKRSVDIHVFASEVEGAVVKNLERKGRDAQAMADELSIETREAMRAEVRGVERATNAYAKSNIEVPAWMKESA